ncbi:MAG: hypothetical protein KDD02_24035 [Phaeodactylibacter sp.]|nr:hypothetical protein [Phaeodactylibacter sp.]MCB9300507.1 hypothetical protein [Lewinellaceae bacterium]HQU58513.1 hypothetical protein [Saprospiraceae bacterium]
MADDTFVTKKDAENKKRGMMVSVAFHVALIMLAILPLLTFPDPPPGQAGILVNLGLPDVGQGDENAGPSEPVVEETPDQPVQEETAPPVSEPSKTKPEPKPEKPVLTTEDPSAVALRKEKERKEKERLDQLEKDRQARAAEEAKKKAAADAAAARKAEEARKQQEAADFGKSLGLEGLGKGKGETGKPGNQGDPGGDPNADRVTGISTGSGVVEGLGGRGATTRNTPQDNSSETGTVVVRVCIDKNGNVVEAKFSQKGEKTSSTVTSGRLVNLAVESAKKWKFSPGEVDKQCGWIIFNFKAK